jgi:hypothetical protein
VWSCCMPALLWEQVYYRTLRGPPPCQHMCSNGIAVALPCSLGRMVRTFLTNMFVEASAACACCVQCFVDGVIKPDVRDLRACPEVGGTVMFPPDSAPYPFGVDPYWHGTKVGEGLWYCMFIQLRAQQDGGMGQRSDRCVLAWKAVCLLGTAFVLPWLGRHVAHKHRSMVCGLSSCDHCG